MRMETALAKASQTRVERRDPHKLVHKMKIADLAQLAPSFDWPAYYRELQYPQFGILNVTAPEFFKGVGQMIAAQPMANWKIYLRWHLLHESAPFLPAAETFARITGMPVAIACA